jgi:protein gp37
MGKTSEIQWTDATWNIARGCRKVDEDCKFCYMYRDSMNATRYNPLEVKRTKTVFDMPLKLKEPSRIFTCSLTDFFLPEIDEYRHEAWDIIRKCPQHTFQILTKRPERINESLPEYWDEIRDRVWLGISIGSTGGIHRLRDLDAVYDSVVKFLSIEPLHGPIDLMAQMASDSGFVDWVIVGGESGHETGKYRYRPCELQWIEKIVNDCRFMGIPVFVKQMGTHLAKQLQMSDRHGGNIEEFPEHLRIREFPMIHNHIP